ncbi:uncharacterized protein CTRU02_201598 [Colletotrichum truncatum]|uniref:Uncharacterized protein n=1 Tax=Colletotrichum truncatum TaxID=5467 RepID=A0ACC3ZHX1_COLTU|nr:uncharacterized protein CTRU02_10827 [Colletotrichum truncatum]KAF6786703.1 hypothetical protein CTRU02_10827 [Colletotrichum truncatum]
MKFQKISIVAVIAYLVEGTLVAAQDSLTTLSSAVEPPPRTVNGEYGCYTDFGPTSRDVQTFSRVYYITQPITRPYYIPAPTTTITVTPTALPPSILPATNTITCMTTITTTTRITSFVEQTVQTPSGFTPLASAIYRPNGGFLNAANAKQPENNAADIQQQSLKLRIESQNAVVAQPQLYPQRVVCERVVHVYTTTTQTYTMTGVHTSTVTAPAPTHSNPVFPVQYTTTITTTTTSTITDVAPNPTYTAYEACQSNNLVSQVTRGRRPIIEAENGFGVTQEQHFESSAYNCCVACQRENECTGSLFYANTCYTFRGWQDTCMSPGELRWSRRATFGGSFTASNGKCGSWGLSRTPPSTESDF